MNNLIILSAGHPHTGEVPALLTKVSGQNLFSWQLSSLNITNKPQVITGYKSKDFDGLKDKAILIKNNLWESTKSASSLLCADLSFESVTVSYSDILYRSQLLKSLQSSKFDITIAYDSLWQKRFLDRTEEDMQRAEKVMIKNNKLLRAGSNMPSSWADGEFIGLVHFNKKALEFLNKLKKEPISEISKMNLSDLLEYMRLKGFEISAIDAKGDWAELNEPKDIAHFILGTKAQTLDRLSSMVKESKVLNQVSFEVYEWKNKQEKIIQKIKEKFITGRLVVRSSAKSEDAFTHSNAGAYTSVLKVEINDTEIIDAVNVVINSYIDCQDDDQVLVQPMLEDVLLSGVAFTRTLELASPFYVVNYDETGDTESITSGNSKEHKSLFFRKDSDYEMLDKEYLKNIIKALKEVENILNYDALDIEFAVDSKYQVYLLQARPITAISNVKNLKQEHILELQSQASLKFENLQAKISNIKGDKALFGVMPDWNPAEIIGTNPGKLAISLYQHLILNDVWATQRAEYGYKDVRPQELLTIFAGKPYINIRASFNSFTPKNIDEKLTEKLINFYLEYLISQS